jgi:nickel superoxide dismutase
MKKIAVTLTLALFALLTTAAVAGAHCEIPCGIYDDQVRADLIAEHITTIEKSMRQIEGLSKADSVNYNQLVRWINNKELHANKLQEIVTQYFMTQRIKLDADKYDEKIGVLHQMLVYAMRAKQTTDLAHIEKLRSLLKEFQKLYFGHSHD